MEKTQVYGIAIQAMELFEDEDRKSTELAAICALATRVVGADSDDMGTLVADTERGYAIFVFVNKKNRDLVYEGIEKSKLFEDFCKLDGLSVDEKGLYLSEVC